MSESIQVHFVFRLVGHSSSFNLGVKWLSWQHSCRRNVSWCITMYYLTVSVATGKQPEDVKCVNSSPWGILKFKTLEKSTLCICTDMLIYPIQVCKRSYFKKRIAYWHNGDQRVKPYKSILCSGWSVTLHLSILESGSCHDNTVVEVHTPVLWCTGMHYNVIFNRIYGNSQPTRCHKICRIWKQFTMVYIVT